MTNRIRVAVIGAGHWGPNLVRNVAGNPRSTLAAVCDRDPERLARISAIHPDVRAAVDSGAVIADETIDAVVIATPSATHFDLAREALLAGKHVLLEKPAATRSADVDTLDTIATERGRTLLIGHVFLYHGAVQHMRELVASGELGDLRYLHARRTNLGPVRHDVHAAWDLAAHDISIFLHLTGARVVEVTAAAQCCIRPGIPDVVFATLFLDDGTLAHVHTSWLDPQKVRTLTVVGSRRMAVFDDLDITGPIRVFDRGVTMPPPSGAALGALDSFQVELVQGDLLIPRIVASEPLRAEFEAFLDSIATGARPVSDARLGARVVRVLEAMDASIAEQSRRVPVLGEPGRPAEPVLPFGQA